MRTRERNRTRVGLLVVGVSESPSVIDISAS